MNWWIWVVVGIILLALEIFTPSGFTLLFIGLGAILTGFLTKFGFLQTLALRWSVFGLLSIFFLVFLRKKLMIPNVDKTQTGNSGLMGETVVAISAIHAGETGQGELHGTRWTIKNVGESTINKDASCKVVGINGVALDVK